MKFIRFLTTLIVIHLLNIGATASAQDIAEFEFRKLAPTSPFLLAADIVPVDDAGHVIPSNQCQGYSSHSPYLNRCGFSAGDDSRFVPVKPKPQREIDLSPISFECFESGCEYEYQNSTDEFSRNLEIASQWEQQVPQESASEDFDHLFSNASNVRELIEQQFGNEELKDSEFIPYYSPSESEGADPFSFDLASLETADRSAKENRNHLSAPVANLASISSMSNLLIEKLSKSEWLSDPENWIEQKLLDLECKMCGTPAMSLHYNFMAELERQKNRIETRKQRKLKVAMSSANFLRFLGNQLINAADQIAPNPAKNINGAHLDINSDTF
jgi:hypothetical protein